MGVGSEELDYQETISLLQEEVARLEGELRSRDEAAPAARDPEPHDREADEAARRQVASLTAEIASREETIGLLLEQARLFEEAEAADRANWDQLNQWVQQLEERIEGGAGAGGELREELEAERRRSESDRQAVAAERRSWEAQRQALEAESEKLRTMLSQAARRPDGSGDAVLKQLEQENRRLRAATGELARATAAAAEAEELREQLRAAQEELAGARRELQQTTDDLRRERNEHEVVLAGLRSQMARESLKRQEEHVKAAVGPTAEVAAAMSVDDRIRAFRQHLKDIHEQEEHDRAQKKLSARLSRLWRNTGPRG